MSVYVYIKMHVSLLSFDPLSFSLPFLLPSHLSNRKLTDSGLSHSDNKLCLILLFEIISFC